MHRNRTERLDRGLRKALTRNTARYHHPSTNKKVLTEMIRQDRITNTDVASNTLVEASLSKDSVSGRQMLFAIQALVLEVIEHRIRSDFQRLARSRLANGADGRIVRCF